MILLKDYQVSRDGKHLFAPVDLRVQAGQCCVIMGESGIGKTSMLTDLHLHYLSDDAFMVFQENNQLFPWLTIRQNLDIATKIDYLPLVKQWNLEQYLDKESYEISGGQIQRFTLIRAVCSGNNILLCDEPLSALDSITGLKIIKDFKNIVKERNLTVLWITHNWNEAKFIGDQVYYLSKNGLQDITKEDDVYDTLLFN